VRDIDAANYRSIHNGVLNLLVDQKVKIFKKPGHIMGMGLIVYVMALVIVLLFLKWLTDWRNRKYLYLLIVVILIAAGLWYQGILYLE